MHIELKPIDQVIPYARNPRINEGAVATVAASIKEFGWQQPLVTDADGIIVVGHTRLLAARQLGLTEVPVHVAKNLTPAQAKAFRILDNKSHELSAWNLDLLPLELHDLKTLDIDLASLGFTTEELNELLAPPMNEGLCDPDLIPAPPDQAVSQPGDLWTLGNHRLFVGDSSKAEDVDRLLGGQPIHLANTDPPYNVKVEPRSNNAIAAGLLSFAGYGNSDPGRDVVRCPQSARATHKKLRAKDRPLANDFVSDEAFAQMLLAWFGNIARVLLPGRAMYCWGGYANVANYPPALKACGLYFSQTIIWHKQHPVLTRKDFMGDHEWCFYSWREGAGHQFFGPNNVPDVWSVKKVNPATMEHLTQKPVELAARAIQYSSRAGENVLDLFGGSGSTLIACEQHGRRAFLMEIDPLYADVIVDRYQRFSGKPAVLERTGESPIQMRPREVGMR